MKQPGNDPASGRLGPRYGKPERANPVARSIGDIQSPIAAFRHLAVQVSQYLARQRNRLAAGSTGVGELDAFGVREVLPAPDVEEEARHRASMRELPKRCNYMAKPARY